MILLDTDVLLDVALDRAPHAESSVALLDHLERTGKRAFVAWHSLSNLYYLVRPSGGDGRARAFLADLMSFALVAPTDSEDLAFAAALPLRDLEDAMQVAAARACGAVLIATRNVDDFEASPVPARTPERILAEGLV